MPDEPVSDNPLDGLEPSDPAADPQGGSMSVAEAVQMVQEAQAPLLDRIAEMTESTNQRFEQMAQQFQSQNPPPASQPDEPTDFLTELTSGNGEAAIARIVQNQISTLNPFLANMARSGSDAFTGIEAQQVDADFGDGAWDKLFAKPMQVLMDQHSRNNPAAMVDSSLIRNEVNMLKGQLLNDLVEYRSTHQSKTTEQENEKLGSLVKNIEGEIVKRTNATGGLRRIESGSEEVTPELQNYLAERSAAIGKPIEAKQWLLETDYGNDIDSYRANKVKLAKQNGAMQ